MLYYYYIHTSWKIHVFKLSHFWEAGTEFLLVSVRLWLLFIAIVTICWYAILNRNNIRSCWTHTFTVLHITTKIMDDWDTNWSTYFTLFWKTHDLGRNNDLPIQVTAARGGNLAGAFAAPADNFFRSRKFVSHDELCDVSFGELVIILTRRCLLLQAPLAPAASLHTSLRLRLWSHTWCRIMLPIIITVTNANFAMNDESHRALFSLWCNVCLCYKGAIKSRHW